MLTNKYPFLLGALLLGSLSANAQNGVSAWPQIQDPNAPVPSNQNRSNQPAGHARVAVDMFGNVTRSASQMPLNNTPSLAGVLANQAIIGSSTNANSIATQGSAYGNPNFNRNRNNGYGSNGYGYNNQYYGNYGNVNGGYCPPAPAYCPPTYPAPYPYPYAYPTNNYYYPPTAYAIPVAPRPYDWAQGATVTVGPTVGYSAPAYPYPYPAPYPYQGYPYASGAYGGTTTIITGSNQGGISTQSRSSGYSASVGRNGVTGHVSNRSSSSSTYVTTR